VSAPAQLPAPGVQRRDSLAIEAFTVPPRFQRTTFESYRPDPAHPSQAAALDRLHGAMLALNRAAHNRGMLGRLRRGTGIGWQAYYLDGRFGVGKTHLLAAAFHFAHVPKAYLSFQDLTYAVGALQMQRTVEMFSRARLICLDEFELDDPGNTMLATSFVRGVLDRGARLIVTSNTLPGELGRGRFSADEFEREIGTLAAAFDTLTIDGEDYRHRRFDPAEGLPRVVPAAALAAWGAPLPWLELLQLLRELPPLHYVDFIAGQQVMLLAGVAPIADQDTALRFVHFVDKLYDRGVPLIVSMSCSATEIFPPTYGHGGFERKFRRCQSRLHELLAQPVVAKEENDARRS
jgi:cell division protein ZapE